MENYTFQGVMKDIADRMILDFEQSRNIQHTTIKGDERESIVVEHLLNSYLPKRYGIGSGIIVDSEAKESRQQDLIIYDQFFSPLFLDLKNDQYYFPESVFIAIEVKSNLDTGELENIIKKSASVWNLKRNPFSEIVLRPGLLIPNLEVPTLCMGFCFESSMSLKDIPDKAREYESGIRNGNALSMICILKDKEGEAGVLINTQEENLFNPQIIPSSDSRLGLLKCKDAGDALLYTYLLMMEHLRLIGSISSGPNLLEYMKGFESGNSQIKVSTKEMRGAFVNIDGNRVKVDVLSRIRELGIKIFSQNASDEEILEFYYIFPQIPSGESFMDPKSKIFVDGKAVDFPKPLAIYEAIKRHFLKKPDENDQDILNQFVELIKSIGTKYKEIRIGYYNNEDSI